MSSQSQRDGGDIRWSQSAPTLAPGPDDEDQPPSEPPQRRRDFPTPHPKKASQADSYFPDVQGQGQGRVRSHKGAEKPSAGGPPGQGSGQGRQPRPSGQAQARLGSQPPHQPGAQSQPRRATLPRRSSTMDSDFFRDRLPLGRTFSRLEEGPPPEEERGRAEGRTQGVVGELIKFGLTHGLGRVRDVPPTIRRGSGMLTSVSSSRLYERDEKAGGEGNRMGREGSGAPAGDHTLGRKKGYRERCQLLRERRRSSIMHHVEDYTSRQKFILRLAKALLSFGAPSHRIESQLLSAAEILDIHVAFVHLPNLIMVTFMSSETRTSETHFVRAGGRVQLTKLHKVHLVIRDVLHDKVGVTEGCEQLKKILQEKPIYPIWIRCFLAFLCASIICVLSFGGSIIDMFISGLSASVLQYLGLNAASKSTIYANVYEISVSIIVSFVARLLGTLPGNIFCYSAISSAGVVLILPGFTILIAALELTSRNILCGSVRMVYAIIYTLFLGFGLTIGSDFYLLVNPQARRNMAATAMLDSERLHGYIINSNASTNTPLADMGATFTFMQTAESGESNIIKGCYRNPSWPWYRQPFPWWTMLFLVPLYSTCSSIANLQAIRSIQLPVMVVFSCAAYAANRVANYFISDRGDIVSAFGAFVIGLCGNLYSRIVGGTAFTAMVTGVLFLVPSAIGNGGGLIQNYNSSAERYSGSFELGIRMIQVAIGVTIGLFVSQILVYALGRRKSAAHFAF